MSVSDLPPPYRTEHKVFVDLVLRSPIAMSTARLYYIVVSHYEYGRVHTQAVTAVGKHSGIQEYQSHTLEEGVEVGSDQFFVEMPFAMYREFLMPSESLELRRVPEATNVRRVVFE
jgi:hypothetical protein